MKAKSLLLYILVCLVQTLSAQTFETATEAVANMGMGWNLGNSLDSHKAGVTDVTKTEILRGQSPTKPELMKLLKEAGFGAVRVPVTWYPHMSNDGTVDAAWMNRVKAVVDLVLAQNMYCIINVHHDGNHYGSGTFPGRPWLKATMANYNDNHTRFENLWTQIANAFKNYDQRLIFEGYNELLDSYKSWNYASFNCENKYDASVAADAYNAINSYAQSFVNAVRATGGNNTERNLVVNTYAASCARGTWSQYLTEPLSELQLPNDVSSNHIIFGVHTYPRISNTDEQGNLTARPVRESAQELDAQFSNLTDVLAAKGAPVIISEWGSSNVDATVTDYDALRNHYLSFAEDFVNRAKAAGIALFHWMGISDRADRTLAVFTQPDLAEKILRTFHGDNFTPCFPSRNDYDGLGYKITFLAQWGEALLKAIEPGDDIYTKITVEFAERTMRGRLYIRAYYSDDDSDYVNHTIQSVPATTFPFRDDGSQPKRVVLKYTSADLGYQPIIRRVYLTKSDGSIEEVQPRLYSNCYINLVGTPRFTNVDVSDALYTSLYYGDKKFIVPESITAKAYKVENDKLVSVMTYETDDVIPNATGVVLRANTPGTYMFRHTNEEGILPLGSMLRGSDVAATTTGGDTYYMLSLNSNLDIDSAGFYYGVAGGAPFTNPAHKAYLAVPAAQNLTPRYLFNDAEDFATGLNILNQDNTALGWYTVDGRKLTSEPTTSGIYIHNGRKVIK